LGQSWLTLGNGKRTRRGWVVSTTPRPLYPRERPGTHCIGGWVGPRASLDVCEKFRPHRIIYLFILNICSYLVLHCSGIGLSIVVCIVSYCMLWIFPAGKFRRLRSGENPRYFFRSPDRPARSQSLYRLSYPAHKKHCNETKTYLAVYLLAAVYTTRMNHFYLTFCRKVIRPETLVVKGQGTLRIQVALSQISLPLG
jgi:hypothetical protein